MKRFNPIILLFVLLSSFSTLAESPFSAPKQPGFGASQAEFLPVDQAFAFSYQQQGNDLVLSWDITPEHYLYHHQFKFTPQGVQLGEAQIPQGKSYVDEYFGEVEIFDENIQLRIPLSQVQADATVDVQYQGCAKAGLCYPPEIKKVYLTPINATSSSASNEAPQASEQGKLANMLSEQSLLLNLLVFFALGVGLAFTPCVFPMYPILSGIIVGQGQKLSLRRAFTMSMVYVQGMALTYTLLGLVVASAGLKYQAALQHPAILITLAALFAVLSLSMFGLYNLQLPSGMQEKLSRLSNKQKGGSIGGVFVMGLISGLVCSPCTTAPLSGALLYVANSGDLLLGGAALYALSMGMGLPLIVLGTSGGKLLPKAGGWMNVVKVVFGFLLLTVSVVMLDRLLPDWISQLLFAALLIGLFIYFNYVNSHSTSSNWKHIRSAMIMLGLGVSSVWAYQAVEPQISKQEVIQEQHFIQIKTVEELQTQLALAKADKQSVMLDFYADWCISCKEFEQLTFSDPRVQDKFDSMLTLQADVTGNDEQDTRLLEHLDILGLPTLVFFNSAGDRVENARITGFVNADYFLSHLEKNQL